MFAVHRNSRGFGVMGIVLVVLVVGLVGFAGWTVWKRQHPDSTRVQRQSSAVDSFDNCLAAGGVVMYSDPPVCEKDGQRFTQAKEQGAPEVALDSGYVPAAGWKVEGVTNNYVRVVGGKKNCSVSGTVVTTTDAKKTETAKFTADLFQDVIDSAKSRGFTVTKVDPAGMGGMNTLKVDGGNGAETFETLEIQVAGNGQRTRQTYAYIVGDGKYGEVRISCDGDDYTGAQLGDDRGDDSQVIHGSILPALRFKVLS